MEQNSGSQLVDSEKFLLQENVCLFVCHLFFSLAKKIVNISTCPSFRDAQYGVFSADAITDNYLILMADTD